MKGVILGSIIGAALVFMWGFLFWGVLPFGNTAVVGVEDQAGLQAQLDAYLDETGVYMLPFSKDETDAEYQALHAKGPIATVYYRAEGSEPMAPSTFLMGYLHEVVVLLIMGIMLKLAAVGSYGSRFVVVLLGGFAGSCFSSLAGPIWWLEPWNRAVIDLSYQAVAWLLAALVMAAMVKPAGRDRGNEV
ncbi:MAG: hypothetical protein ACSHXK_06505 [Oceanococcus sp.]